MREMKNRLLAIEAELQTLYRDTSDESEVSLTATKPPSAQPTFKRLSFLDDRLLLSPVILLVERLVLHHYSSI